MKCSEAISQLSTILECEGDIEIELPDGTLLQKLDVFTVADKPGFVPSADPILHRDRARYLERNLRTANGKRKARKPSPGGQKKKLPGFNKGEVYGE